MRLVVGILIFCLFGCGDFDSPANRATGRYRTPTQRGCRAQTNARAEAFMDTCAAAYQYALADWPDSCLVRAELRGLVVCARQR